MPRGLLIPGGKDYYKKVLSVAPNDLILYQPMSELSGAVAYDLSLKRNHGVYTGVTLGQPGIGDGRTCPLFSADEADYNNIYSAALNTDLDGDEGTVAGWVKLATDAWTDSTNRWMLRLFGGAGDELYIHKQTSNNTLTFLRRAASANKSINAGGQTSLDWIHLAMTWSKTTDELKGYINGIQVGSTQSSLGSWGGTLGVNNTLIGNGAKNATNPWDGWLAHQILLTTPLATEQVKELAVR